MNETLIGILLSLVGSLVTVLVFLYLSLRDRSSLMRIWTLAWTFQALRYIFDLLNLESSLAGSLFFPVQSFRLLASTLLLYGVYRLQNKDFPSFWIILGLIVWALTGSLHFLGIPFFYKSIPLSLASGVMLMVSGIYLFRDSTEGGRGKEIAAMVFCLWGIHKILSPFWGGFSLLQPWSFIVGAVLTFLAGQSLLLFILDKDRALLQKEKDRYFQVFYGILEGFSSNTIIYNKNGDPIDYVYNAVNMGFERITSLSSHQLINKRFTEIFGPIEKSNLHIYAQTIADGQPRVFEFFSDRFGKYFKANVFKQCQDTFGLLIVDISDRFQAEKNLHEQKEKLEVLLSGINDAVISTDEGGKIQWINPPAEALVGIPKGQAKDKFFWEVVKIKSFKQFKSTTQVESAQNLQKKVVSKRAYLLNIRGSFCPIDYSVSPVSGGAVVVISDETHRVLYEDEVQRVQKMDSLALLAGGIAHDFNNLLSGVLGNLSLLHNRFRPESPESLWALQAEDAVQKAAKLTNQLLTFSDGGDPKVTKRPILDLIRVAAENTLRGTNMDWEVKALDDPWVVSIDEDQILLVLEGLFINALQAAPQGHVKVTIRSLVGSSDQEERLEIRFEDNGPGIPPEILSKVFDPFFTTKPLNKGLGLTLAYSIIRKHNGSIVADTLPQGGAAIIITLPAELSDHHTVPANKSTTPCPVTDQTGTCRDARVLVLDDEPMIRELLKNLLSVLGYECVTTKDGRETILTYREAMEKGQPFDVLILDLTVPGGMGGEETMKKIREIDPSAKALASSGYSRSDVISNFKQYGFVGVLPKPYQLSDLKGALDTVIQLFPPGTDPNTPPA